MPEYGWSNTQQTIDPQYTYHPNQDNLAGGGGRYVDNTYQYDANGNYMSPEQQQYWRDYDHNRATAAAIRASYGRQGAATTGPNGQQPVYHAASGKWSIYNPTSKGWDEVDRDGLKAALNPDLYNSRPEWQWGAEADQQDALYQRDTDYQVMGAASRWQRNQNRTQYSPSAM